MAESNTISEVIFKNIDRIRGSGLLAKGTRSVMALGAGTVAGQGMKFIRRMILARILVPDEIGMMAIIISLSMAFEAFTEVGVKSSVIQNKRGADPDYLNIAWWMQAVRGVALFVIAFLAAPWISSFYDKPELLKLMQVSFLVILFKGFISPRAHVLEREYKFGWAVFLMQGSAVLGTVITIVLAFMIRNVWALVAGFVAEAAIWCLLSYVVVPFCPRFRIERTCLGELMKFARGVFGVPILAMISFQVPVLVLAKLITEYQLGLYSYAALLAYFPIDLYMRVINPVLLPVFSEKQEDRDSLCRTVLLITKWTAVLCIPLIVFMVCCGHGILLLVYNPEYATMAVVFGVLCLQILLRNQGAILASLYFSVGQPHLHRRFVALRAVVIAGLIYPAILYFGPLGAAAVIVLGNFAALLMQVVWCRMVIDLKFTSYLYCYNPGLLLGLPVILAIGLLWLFQIDSPLLVLIVGLLTLIVTLSTRLLMLLRDVAISTIREGSEDKSLCLSSADAKSV